MTANAPTAVRGIRLPEAGNPTPTQPSTPLVAVFAGPDETLPAGVEPQTAVTIAVAEASAGDAVHVTADGVITTGRHPGPRLCVLDEQTAADLLSFCAAVVTDTATVSRTEPEPPAGAPPHRPGPARRVHLDLLGRIEVRLYGKPVPIRRTAGLQVLAFLAVHPDGATAADLTGALWPGLQTATITGRLYTTLSNLRRQLRLAANQPVIARRDDRYVLDPSLVDVDLWRLRAAATTTASVTDDAGRQVGCHDVIALYQGPHAQGHAWPWLEKARTAVQRTVLEAYAYLVDTARTVGEQSALLRRALAVYSALQLARRRG